MRYTMQYLTYIFMDVTQEIGNRIRYYRVSKKISQEKLSELSSLHPSYIGQLERGEKTPSIETLYKICQGMDISLVQLLYEIDAIPSEHSDCTYYAFESYKLIENQTPSNQKHLYNVIKEITNMNK